MLKHLSRFRVAGSTYKDRFFGGCGAALCIAITAYLCRVALVEWKDVPFILGPIGASAVLLFVVPSSPLAQPWAVVGGSSLSALVGVTVFNNVSNIALAAGLAVGGAIFIMSITRSLHPPGGAVALTAVIGSESIHHAGYMFAILPVGVNAVVLVLLAMLYHRFSGHSYPHRPAIVPAPPQRATVEMQDIDVALSDMHESFDISREDLQALFLAAQKNAQQRIT